MVITHNMSALNTHLSLRKNDRLMTASMRRLSTGYRINSAGDDAAGLAISYKLAYQVAGLNKASENSTNGISMIQTAEGALAETHNMLQRMRELAVQAANDTMTADDRTKIQIEIDELTDEISAIADRTEFNRLKLLSGEGSRVSASVWMDGGSEAIDKTVSRILVLSDNMPTGSLEYTVEAPGLPAVAEGVAKGQISDFTPVPAAGVGVFLINTIKIEVSEDDTYGSVRAKINEACNYSSIRVHEDASNGKVYLISEIAGTDHKITIQGKDDLLNVFGLQSCENIEGKDAAITVLGMKDQNGNPIESYNSSISCVADGNRVTIAGADMQTVQLSLQLVLHNNLDGSLNTPGNTLPPLFFTYGDNDTDKLCIPYVDGVGFDFSASAAIDMRLDVKDYGPIKLQIGPGYNMSIAVQIPRVNAETLGLVEYTNNKMQRRLNYQTVAGATLALQATDDAIAMVSAVRARLGTYQNRLESTIRNLDITAENTETSRSRIQDTDMAREMTLYSQYNIMNQAGMAILGQANMRPQQIISLLQ